MRKKSEPKIKFIYNSEPMPESLRKEMYERFMQLLVALVKENTYVENQRFIRYKIK